MNRVGERVRRAKPAAKTKPAKKTKPAAKAKSASRPATKYKRAARPTDIERFVEDPQRQKLVAEVRKKIDELGIDYLYLQFVSVTGRIMGKGIPADHWESVAKKGFQLVYGATMNLFLNRHGDYLGYGPEAAELIGIPEPETFMQLPWDKRVARLWCTLFRNREEREEPGAFLTADARGNLRRIHDQFKKQHGLELRHGTEPEMMWLKKDAEGQPAGGYSNPYCYHIDQFESLRPVYLRVIDYCRKMGLDMIQGDHEDSPGQLELNFTFDDALRTADRLATYRQICAQVAREFGIIACFMCKPFMGVSANGCHHNISLWRGGKDETKTLGNDPKKLPGMVDNYYYRSGGHNTFMPDTDDVQLPGKIGLKAIGGIVKHLGALTAIGCSTVNSYRRLWDTGFWAPVFSDWGFQNRTTGLRVSAPGRFEYRAVDAMVNPHLMAAALIRAMDDGIKNNLDPGPPEERNIYQAMEAGKQVKKLPMTLGDALAALEKDPVIRSAMPGEMYRLYDEYKRDEWERFNHTVTEWDLKTYLDCLP